MDFKSIKKINAEAIESINALTKRGACVLTIISIDYNEEAVGWVINNNMSREMAEAGIIEIAAFLNKRNADDANKEFFSDN